MSIDKLKTKFFTGAWLTDVKHYFTKINEIIDYLNGVKGNGSYKEYIAFIQQSDTDPPTVTIIKNTLGEITWTRSNPGYYSGNFTFPAVPWEKCFLNPLLIDGSTKFSNFTYVSDSSRFDIGTYTSDSPLTPDDNLLSSYIEIRFYN